MEENQNPSGVSEPEKPEKVQNRARRPKSMQRDVTAFLRDVKKEQPITLTAPYFSEDFIDLLCERGFIPENPYNKFRPENDASFLKGMMEFQRAGRSISDRQKWKLDKVLQDIAREARRNQENLRARKEDFLLQQEKRREEEKKYLPTISDLTEEQKELINRVKAGENVLVDACIGSGKTTTIQVLCGEMPGKKILYLTYNRLLKNDAQKRITNPGTQVTNYHGFAVGVLRKHGVPTSPSDAIQKFNAMADEFDKERRPFPKYDLIILDEYQDVEQEIAEELEYIKKRCPDAQIVAVGDMEQKIYDKTTLDVRPFINHFLGEHSELSFTQCFRLSREHAAMLGDIWGKEIRGVNPSCRIRHMTETEVTKYLAEQNPGDILCLGTRTGSMTKVLNKLESHYPDVYNKDTVYASIKDEDRTNLDLNGDVGIFTTYDSSKGMERKICVVFDYDEANWTVRLGQPMQKKDILRNIFCVAASRGKEEIIFVDSGKEMLRPETIKEAVKEGGTAWNPFYVSDMFDHKYKKDVEACMEFLEIKRKRSPAPGKQIEIVGNDGLMDISPCIGNYQSAKFFRDYDIDEVISEITDKLWTSRHKYPALNCTRRASLLTKLLYLTYLETGQERYVRQAETHFITKEQSDAICERLSCMFTGKERTEVPCKLEFQTPDDQSCRIDGRIDVIRKGSPVELKFVTQLEHKHFLQIACYLAFTGKKKGYLWNVRNNELYAVSVTDRQKFLDAVIRAITKGKVPEYVPCQENEKRSMQDFDEWERS